MTVILGMGKSKQRVGGHRSLVWQTEHSSLQGDKHVRDGSPCQDASDSRAFDDGRWAYVVVADGHGSDRHFRSAEGSALAVATMRDVFHSFRELVRTLDGPPVAELAQAWESKTGEIVQRWRAKIHTHLVGNPARVPGKTGGERGLVRYLDDFVKRNGYSQLEQLFWQLRRFETYSADALSQDVEALGPLPYSSDPRWDQAKYGGWQAKAYGTTLLGVLVGPETVHWVQIGDGAMVQIVGGEASYIEPPPAEALGNLTPSLCDEDAQQKLRYGTIEIHDGQVPSGIVLVTDGVPNSYHDTDGFFRFCKDVSHRADTLPSFTAELPKWLQEISRKGSGDDVSVALAWSRELPTPGKPAKASSITQQDDGSKPGALAEVHEPTPDVQRGTPSSAENPSYEERIAAKIEAAGSWVTADPPNALAARRHPVSAEEPKNEEEVVPGAEDGRSAQL